MIYRVVKKARTLYHSDATDCMLKLIELGKALHFKNSKMCLDCKLYLNLELVGHRSSSRKCSVHCKNWRFLSWDC